MSARRNVSKLLGGLATSLLLGAFPLPAVAQPALDRSRLPIPTAPFDGVANRTLEGSKPDWPRPITAPAGAPNVLLVLVDDAGFGNPATFGGPIATPNLDRLAQEGLRYNAFHVTALCSPSRAALLSGRNQHAVGFGSIPAGAGGWPGYNARWPRSAASIARILQGNGYATAAFGKWHLTPANEWGPQGPFDGWPSGLGFDHFWGFLGGDTDQYQPLLFENRTIAGSPTEKDFFLTTVMADRTVAWMRQHKSVAPRQPFFVYFATGGTHAPHQVPRKWSDKYKGKFDSGWDAYRETVFARQKELGVIPANARLTPRDPVFPAWETLPDDQKKLYARQMEVYAGFGESTDHEIGRVLGELQALGERDNTLVFYIWGDNGASMEGTETGSFNEQTMQNGIPLTPEQQLELIKAYGGLEAWGGPTMEPHYAAAWAWAGNAPFQWGKQIASHLGGTRDGMVVAWPGRITDKGGLRRQFTHVIDVAPTILEMAGVPAPSIVDGAAQMPHHGVSFAYTFADANAAARHTQQYFEVFGNRAMYKDGWWLACRMPRIPWKVDAATMAKFAPGVWDPDKDPCELYNLETDFSQADDLAARHPDKVRELRDLWWQEARKYQVLPLLGGMAFAYGFKEPGPATSKLTFLPGTENLSPGVAPDVYNRSWTMTADVVVPATDGDGVIVAEADYLGGYALYVLGGRPAFTYSFMGVKLSTIVSSDALTPGDAQIRYEFTSDAPGKLAAGGTGRLFINGKPVAEDKLAHTVPLQFSAYAGFDIGRDNGLPVVPTGEYRRKAPFPFGGTIRKVEFELK